jgi:hypothetical protein
MLKSLIASATLALVSVSVHAAIRTQKAPLVCTGVGETCADTAHPGARDGILLETRVHFNREGRKFDVANKTIFDLKEGKWVRAIDHKDGLVVYAYAQLLDRDTVKVTMRVMDTSSGKERLIANPILSANFGMRSFASQDGEADDGMKIDVMPNHIRYEPN